MFRPDSADADTASEWGYLIGLWHDLGKFAPDWQEYLRSKADMHRNEVSGKVDHSTVGAKHAVGTRNILGHLIAYAVAGHHSGLLDAISADACLEKRLQKEIPSYASAPAEILKRNIPKLPRSIAENIRVPFVAAFFARMLFSALVDADFLATEAFMEPARTALRPRARPSILPEMLKQLDRFVTRLPAPDNEVGRARLTVRSECIAAAEEKPGLFSLTVPTGGGKTLSSLAFALRHAIKHGQQRIIYVVPFISIIEQNAAVFKEAFESLVELDSAPIVLEHHSNLSPKEETERSRLAGENWDAPLIVTTAVQFYESLHAARTSSCRKLHNIANSVVILDEAQCLPVEYLRACLDLLRELTARYHTTVVLCTATQPAIDWAADFPIGLKDVREIISNPTELYQNLKRVEVVHRRSMDDQALKTEIEQREQVLVIVNTRRHAQSVFRSLSESDANFHLSALMCPTHREQTLQTINARLQQHLPVRLISTQVVEAGVDIDFPVVYRALAGLDSIAQAAGRCNRNGRLQTGEVHVFKSEHERSEAYFRETAQVAQQIFALGKDPLGLEAVRQFFSLYYLQHNPPDGPRWDTKNICGEYQLNQDRNLPFQFQYRSVEKKFHLIEDKQVAVLIPFDEKAKALLDELRNEAIPLHRELLRGLQRYMVQIYRREFEKNRAQFESVREDQFHILICPETQYSARFGLHLDVDPNQPLIC
jgi:CRISPR-associated endonuclease/helicase Cas3